MADATPNDESPDDDDEEGLLATIALDAAAGTDERLDKFLVARLAEIESGARPRPDALPADHRIDASRALAQRWIDEGRVRIGLKTLKPATKVRAGDVVLVDLPPPAPPPGPLAPESIPVEILRQDDDVIVLAKPAGLAVHPGAGRRSGTLANALLAASAGKLSTLGGPDRPGIVHRLDIDTSGVMVVARNDRAHRVLAKQFLDRTVEKEYAALVVGSPPDDGVIDLPIARHPVHRKKMSVAKSGGRAALTRFSVVERFERKRERFALLRVKIETGRTHQIRVHCASQGFAVLGDVTYGRSSDLIARQALHAARLAFDHPTSGERIDTRAPVPEDIARALEALRAKPG